MGIEGAQPKKQEKKEFGKKAGIFGAALAALGLQAADHNQLSKIQHPDAKDLKAVSQTQESPAPAMPAPGEARTFEVNQATGAVKEISLKVPQTEVNLSAPQPVEINTPPIEIKDVNLSAPKPIEIKTAPIEIKDVGAPER